MSKQYVEIGSAPCEEDCVQVGVEDYAILARAECNKFISLIKSVLGHEPTGALLRIKSNPHDFGNYYEVVCAYDPDVEEAVNYAFRCESEAPTRWAT